jgi:hypothetical protein
MYGVLSIFEEQRGAAHVIFHDSIWKVEASGDVMGKN